MLLRKHELLTTGALHIAFNPRAPVTRGHVFPI